MKIVIDMYDLGFKMVDMTDNQINIAVERHPEYRDRVYYWKKSAVSNVCYDCSLKTECSNSLRQIEESINYCRENQPSNFNLQPYFKKGGNLILSRGN